MDAWKAVRIGVYVGGAGAGLFVLWKAAQATGLLPAPRASGGGLLVDTLTLPGTKGQFVSDIMQAGKAADASLSDTSLMLLAAWAAHESAWGKTDQYKRGNNVFNVIASPNWHGDVLPGGKDTQYDPGSKTARNITQTWRAYPTKKDALVDIFKVLANGFVNYAEAANALRAGDVNFAAMLGPLDRDASGVVVKVDTRPGVGAFYTAPRSEYQAAVTKLFDEVTALVQQAQLTA